MDPDHKKKCVWISLKNEERYRIGCWINYLRTLEQWRGLNPKTWMILSSSMTFLSLFKLPTPDSSEYFSHFNRFWINVNIGFSELTFFLERCFSGQFEACWLDTGGSVRTTEYCIIDFPKEFLHKAFSYSMSLPMSHTPRVQYALQKHCHFSYFIGSQF